jgi:hypothetical protein
VSLTMRAVAEKRPELSIGTQWPARVIAKVSTYEEGGKVRIPGVARCMVGTK